MSYCEGHQERSGLSLDASAQCASQPLLNSSYKVTGTPTPVSVFCQKGGAWSRIVLASSWRACSEEVGLAHDTHELVLADLAVAVAIGLLDHLLDLVVGHVLT